MSDPLFLVLARNRKVIDAPVIVPKNAKTSPDNSLAPIESPNRIAITDKTSNIEAVNCAIFVDINL